ncbi:MAG TPA: hypothetical protein PKM89_08190, partial [Bacteroidales bacterium]|nr:hypothetical protein [Bacteroidales bacterium]
VRGEFKNGFIEGRMTGSDPNLRFLVQGRANLSNNTGAAAKLFANIGYADLNKLNLYKTDSIAVLSGIVEADFSHINAVGDIEGIIAGSGLSFKNSKGTHALNSLFLESKRIDSCKAYTRLFHICCSGQPCFCNRDIACRQTGSRSPEFRFSGRTFFARSLHLSSDQADNGIFPHR